MLGTVKKSKFPSPFGRHPNAKNYQASATGEQTAQNSHAPRSPAWAAAGLQTGSVTDGPYGGKSQTDPKWNPGKGKGPGRRSGCPPRLPQIRTCPIKAYGSSSHGFAYPLRYPLV